MLLARTTGPPPDPCPATVTAASAHWSPPPVHVVSRAVVNVAAAAASTCWLTIWNVPLKGVHAAPKPPLARLNPSPAVTPGPTSVDPVHARSIRVDDTAVAVSPVGALGGVRSGGGCVV